MSISIKYILQDKMTFWSFFASMLLLLASIIYALIQFHSLPPFLPLYNKMPWGYGRLGGRTEIFIPVILVTTFFIGNMLSSSYIYPKIPLLARLIGFITLFLSLFSCIFVIKIISLVL